MQTLLVRFVLLVWWLIVPGLERGRGAREIAVALASAVIDDAGGAPVYTSHLEDLTAGAFFAFRESSLEVGAAGDCADPRDRRTCRAHGPWQLHGPCGRAPLVEQARCWLAVLHEGRARCPEHPAAMAWGACSGRVATPTSRGGVVLLDIGRMAAAREAKVRALLRRALDESRGSP